MLGIIRLLGDILSLAIRLHRPGMPLARGVSGDAIHDWTRALIQIKRDMEAA